MAGGIQNLTVVCCCNRSIAEKFVPGFRVKVAVPLVFTVAGDQPPAITGY
jgi:hypothetical protein